MKDKGWAYLKEWRKNNPERVKLHRETQKARRKLPEVQAKIKAWAKEYKESGRKKYKPTKYRYNPEKNHIKVSRRWALIHNAEGKFTLLEWQDIKRKQDYTCLHCKKPEPEIKLTIDHIMPLSKGGRHSVENIQGLCLRCNASKGNRINQTP